VVYPSLPLSRIPDSASPLVVLVLVSQQRENLPRCKLGFPLHTVEYDPFIKSQLAPHNELY